MSTTRFVARLGAVVVGSGLLVSGSVIARSAELSLDDRVAAAKAIEQVYWAHRTWPEANRYPKPPFESVLPDAVLRAKVESQLRVAARLESSMNRPPTGAELQDEIVRMTLESKSPDTLRELFAALHDDPFLVAECLARPALVARWAATEDRDSSPQRSAGRPIAAVEPPAGGYTLPAIVAGGGCVNDAWGLSVLTTATGANQPPARQLHTAIWTGAEMIVWGGWDGTATVYGTGGRYDPATDTWSSNNLTTGLGANVPAARYRHTAIWTGTEMIVWGGRNAAGTVFNNGGRYDPGADTWSSNNLTTGLGANVPSARQFHTALWTGSEMIVWGGATAAGDVNTGGKYSPGSDSWAVTNLTTGTGSFTPAARIEHSAVWTGSEMIVWGGLSAAGAGLNNGGVYDPASDTWSLSELTSGTGGFTPSARAFHSAVWTGAEMVVWGGASAAGSAGVNTGGRYNPATDSWALSALTNATGAYVPAARQRHTAIWTGSEMILWGGSTDGGASVLQNGGRFVPVTDSWALTSLTNATGANVPAARQFHSAVWTGGADHRMIVWGGNPNTATGGLYCAACTPLLWHADTDGDGYGAAGVTQVSCTQPGGYVASGNDCNDADPAIHPGATETCNGIDDDCDTVVDDGGNALCTDGDACTVDLCDPTTGCSAVHDSANFDVTGFSAARVDGRDLVVFASAWNSCPPDPLYDPAANLDQGVGSPADCIDINDFHLFMSAFGQSCP